MPIRVAMPGLESDFRADTGEGTQRYGYELYRHLQKMNGITVEKRAYGGRLQYASHMFYDDYTKADIIHIPNFRLFYPLRKGKATTLVTAHDFQPLIAPEIDMNHDATLSNRMWFEMVKLDMRCLLQSDYMICNSTMTRDDAISLGYDKRRVFVANHGIDDRFRKKAKVRKQDKVFKVGYIGGFRARKNVAFAIEAFKRLDMRDAVFELWGKKSFEYDYLRKLAGRDRRIRFMGFAPESRLVDIYDTFDAFVFPSLYEGEGLEILEAQARGLPVIIYKNGKMPKEIKKYCLEANEKEDMIKLLKELGKTGYSNKISQLASGYARNFTWKRTAIGTMNLYKKIYKLS